MSRPNSGISLQRGFHQPNGSGVSCFTVHYARSLHLCFGYLNQQITEMEKLTARLAEGSEQQKLVEQLKEAINNKWCINFYYESKSFCGYRRVEPYLLGELKNHEVALRGFFVPTREQVAEHGLASGWKLYAIDKIDVLRFEV